MTRTFPPEFVWGTATASYQIEGAVNEDGRGPSIWDTFSHTPGKTRDGDTGDVACDHYHRMPEDVALMGELGLQAYRFSIAWSRVIPTGSGEVNPAGLDFYSRLVDELLAKGISPVATLYHWDLPQPLDDEGGWTNRATAERFAEYAAVVGARARRPGRRVHHAQRAVVRRLSRLLGRRARAGAHEQRRVARRRAPPQPRARSRRRGAAQRGARGTRMSMTLNLANVRGASAADADAVRHVDGICNRVFLDPILLGSYPADVLDDLRHITDWGFIKDGDTATINAPIDVLGINYYSPALVTAATPELLAEANSRTANDPHATAGPAAFPGTDLAVSLPQEGPYTEMGWRIEPGSFTELLERVHRDYPGTPLMITENGAAFDDVVAADGSVHDDDRIAYLDGHIGAVLDAIESGADVRGYFCWSLMDNFEWAHGFSKRFGIVRVDYPTGERTLKDSGRWYHDVIARNGLA